MSRKILSVGTAGELAELTRGMSNQSKNRAWIITTLVLIAAGIVAYFVGGSLSRGQSAQRVTAVQAHLQSAQRQLAIFQSIGRLLRASNAVYRAAAALDDRNFGTANTYVNDAIAYLRAVDPAAIGVDPQKVAALESQAVGARTSVATNLQVQRAQLLSLGRAIDALVPPPPTSVP
ncbi:MAG: hypothetical protein ACYC8W_07245 [Candidatus Tyrphobacter sp.]